MRDEELFKYFFDELPDPAAITDEHGTIVKYNFAYSSLIKKQKFKNLSELGIDGLPDPVKALSGKIILNNQSFNYTLKALRETTSFLFILKETLEASDNLDLLNHQIRLALKGANAGWYIADLEKGKAEWDDKTAEIVGITYHEGIAVDKEDLLSFIHPEDREKISYNLTRKNEDYLDYTFRIITARNQTRYVNSFASVLRDKEGNTQKLIGVNFDITDRVLTEIKLKESEERYRFLSESLPHIIWRALPDGRLDYVNTIGRKITGKSKSQLYGHKWISIIHKEDEEDVRTKWSASIRNKKDYFNYQRMKIADGSYHWFNVTGRPKMDDAKKVLFWVGICVDVQETKEYEQRLNLAIESANQGIYDWNLQTNEVNLNHVFWTITGYHSAELPSDASALFNKIVHPGDLPAIHEYPRLLGKDQSGVMEFEYRCLTKTMGYRWMRARSKVVEYDEMGMPVRIIGTQVDIDRSKRMELKLLSTNAHLKNIIQNVPGAVFRSSVTETDHIEFLNEQIFHLTGYKASEYYPNGPLKFADLIQPNDLETLRKLIADTSRIKAGFETTFRIHDKPGKERWIWQKCGFVEIGSDSFLEGIMTDITDKLKAEDRIISATIEAEDAERRRISGEIHDGVQQTLVSSMLSLQSLERMVFSSGDNKSIEEYRKGMKMLQEGTDETRHIANRIMPVAIQEFGLVQTLENTISLLNNRQQIEFHLYDNLNGHRLDYKIETSLYRICQEAIRNALKYSNATEVTIQLMKHGNLVSLSIEDNGIGFDMKTTNLLYTGLGISYMKSRASSLSANFDISSSPGKGTSILVEVSLQRLESR